MDKQEHRDRWEQEAPGIPYGQCWCGCGEKTAVASKTNSAKFLVHGAPLRYVTGHGRAKAPRKTLEQMIREYRAEWNAERPGLSYGECWCGCGNSTPIASQTSLPHGRIQGEPQKWCQGHSTRQERPIFVEDRGHETPCHIWYGAKTSGKAQPDHPYGTIRVGRVVRKVHRVIYEEERGPIPKGFEIHHLCGQTLCVNPDHLQPLSKADHFKTYVDNFSASGLKARWG